MAFLRTHGLPLLIVALATLLSLLALLSVHPSIPNSPDSKEYLTLARKIIATGQVVDPKRTPGYPMFLALIFTLFPDQNLYAVVAFQIALFTVAAFEVYLLSYRLTKRPWIACVIASVVALNVYMLDWAYSIRDEAFSYWLTVTLFLVVERLSRRVSPVACAAFVALSALAIMARPAFLFLPAMVGLALLARAVGMRWARRELAALGLALALVYCLVGAYVEFNGAVNGYFGISYVSDANLFGKVVRYRMLSQSVPPQFQTIQRDAQEFAAQGGDLAWTFADKYGYTRDNYRALGVYARYVIFHDPAHYAIDSARDAVQVWLAPPGVDARGANTASFTLARVVARAELLTYLALPLVALWLAWRLWRGGWRDPALLVTTLLTLMAASTIVLTAVAAYSEFYRLRAPSDWAWLVALALALADAGGIAWKAWSHRTAGGIDALDAGA